MRRKKDVDYENAEVTKDEASETTIKICSDLTIKSYIAQFNSIPNKANLLKLKNIENKHVFTKDLNFERMLMMEDIEGEEVYKENYFEISLNCSTNETEVDAATISSKLFS